MLLDAFEKEITSNYIQLFAKGLYSFSRMGQTCNKPVGHLALQTNLVGSSPFDIDNEANSAGIALLKQWTKEFVR